MDVIKYGASYRSVTALAANGSEAVFTAAANVRGAIVWAASFITENTVGQAGSFLAKATAPTSETDGDGILSGGCPGGITGARFGGAVLPRPVFVPAGKGLYYFSRSAEVGPQRTVLYSLL